MLPLEQVCCSVVMVSVAPELIRTLAPLYESPIWTALLSEIATLMELQYWLVFVRPVEQEEVSSQYLREKSYRSLVGTNGA